MLGYSAACRLEQHKIAPNDQLQRRIVDTDENELAPSRYG